MGEHRRNSAFRNGTSKFGTPSDRDFLISAINRSIFDRRIKTSPEDFVMLSEESSLADGEGEGRWR